MTSSSKPPAGPFVVLEGVDGSGKSTQTQRAGRWLKQRGVPHTLVADPGTTWLGTKLRGILEEPKSRIAPLSEVYMFLAAREQMVHEVIAPARRAGQLVLSDRFSASTHAYQVRGRQLGEGLELPSQEVLSRPTLTILLRIDWHEARQRLDFSKLTRFEREDDQFFKRVVEAYDEQAAANECSWEVVDASQSEEEVFAAITRHIEPLLPLP